jgi:type I restriction enzyme R subunit
LGNDFETIGHGFIDFLRLDDKGFPWVVLEAKAVDQRLDQENRLRFMRA